LLAIATDRVDKDNRDRWMAILALGQFGDTSIAPELVPLVYHGNVNTRWWGANLARPPDGHEFRRRLAGVGQVVEPAWRQTRIATNDHMRWLQQPGWETPEQAEAKI